MNQMKKKKHLNKKLSQAKPCIRLLQAESIINISHVVIKIYSNWKSELV